MRKIALALVVAAFSAAPASAGVLGWNWGDDLCGGTAFETCIAANVVQDGATIQVRIGNYGPGTITGVGLWGLTGALPTSAGASIVGWDEGGKPHINGVVGDNSQKYAVGTTNGINDGLPPDEGLQPGSIATFTFTFGSNASALAAYNLLMGPDAGIGVHSQGYIGCSTKLFVDGPNDVENPFTGGEDNCISVPEPGSMALLATGAMGLAFIARRRRNGAEIVDENGNELD